MGLDMYLNAAKTTQQDPDDKVCVVTGYEENGDYVHFEGVEPIELAYWRKFNALHSWMEQLWEQKGGIGDFNCKSLPLDVDDLDALQKVCEDKGLVPVTGFFFGSQEPVTDEEYAYVLATIVTARNHIEHGYTVYYDPWW